jgi:hypothetical protein
MGVRVSEDMGKTTLHKPGALTKAKRGSGTQEIRKRKQNDGFPCYFRRSPGGMFDKPGALRRAIRGSGNQEKRPV